MVKGSNLLPHMIYRIMSDRIPGWASGNRNQPLFFIYDDIMDVLQNIQNPAYKLSPNSGNIKKYLYVALDLKYVTDINLLLKYGEKTPTNQLTQNMRGILGLDKSQLTSYYIYRHAQPQMLGGWADSNCIYWTYKRGTFECFTKPYVHLQPCDYIYKNMSPVFDTRYRQLLTIN